MELCLSAAVPDLNSCDARGFEQPGVTHECGQDAVRQACIELREFELAERALMSAERAPGHNSKVLGLRGYLYALLGRPAEATELLDTLTVGSREHYVPPCAIALVHARLGDFDRAADWLQRAFDARDVHLMLLPIDPKWDPYRADTRFAVIIERCGFTPTT